MNTNLGNLIFDGHIFMEEDMEEKTKKDEISIEEAFKELDTMIKQLESEDITLEDSFTTYQKGMELIKICNDNIDKVEKKVLILNEEGNLDEF